MRARERPGAQAVTNDGAPLLVVWLSGGEGIEEGREALARHSDALRARCRAGVRAREIRQMAEAPARRPRTVSGAGAGRTSDRAGRRQARAARAVRGVACSCISLTSLRIRVKVCRDTISGREHTRSDRDASVWAPVRSRARRPQKSKYAKVNYLVRHDYLATCVCTRDFINQYAPGPARAPQSRWLSYAPYMRPRNQEHAHARREMGVQIARTRRGRSAARHPAHTRPPRGGVTTSAGVPRNRQSAAAAAAAAASEGDACHRPRQRAAG